jgi:hydrogenase large subunit
VPQATTALPNNASKLRNIIHGFNHVMSHILHFYHLVALDYVKPVVWNFGGSGAFTNLTRPFLAPRYDDHHYISDCRVDALIATGVLSSECVYTLSHLPGWGTSKGDAINNYLTGQYLKALDIRRMCHEAGAIFSGRNPICSGFTPGGITAIVNSDNIAKTRMLLNKIIAFIGSPSDFANGNAFTMMFDVVAAAHLFPEYFWIGNSYGHFMANGVFEKGFINEVSDYTNTVLAGLGLVNLAPDNPDNRGFMRGYRLSAQFPYSGMDFIAPSSLDIMKIGESIAYSRYFKDGSRRYPDASNFKHPWSGVTSPDPDADTKDPNGYSWLKSPRYDTGDGYIPFEVGPLARQVVQGNYYAGVLHDLGYTLCPQWDDTGPDLRSSSSHPYKDCYPGGGPNLTGVHYNGDSVLDRIAARAVECLLMALQVKKYVTKVSNTISGGFSASGCTDPAVPVSEDITKGYGMTEASRGALSHWIKMKNGKIDSYQAVVPTTWNASPKDVLGNPGPAEKSLMNNGGVWVADPNQPIEIPRITHSYDFCIACAVHIITPNGDVKKITLPALPG